ncbi:MAG: hypothetical protein ACREQQ_18760 [Candidatus Binatia bacterium]
MVTDGIEPTSEKPAGANGGNDTMHADRQPRQPDFADAVAVRALTERVADLENDHQRLRRDAFLLAAVTAVVSLLLASSLFRGGAADKKETSRIMSPRFVEAQAFLLKDPQGHVRARLTLE